MKRFSSLVPLAILTALVVAAAVVGVAESPTQPTPPTPVTTTVPLPAATTTTLPTPTPATSNKGTPSPSVAVGPVTKCTFSELAVSLGLGGVGPGHWGQRISFRNVGTTTCTLYGYPGIAMLNAAGQQVAQAQRTLGGYIGGVSPQLSSPPTAILAPGKSGTALIEGTDSPALGAAICQRYSGILITPPTTTQAVYLSTIGCGPVQVHPVIATTPLTINPGSTRTPSGLTVTQLTVVGLPVPEAAAVTPSTGHHLLVEVVAEQVETSVAPNTILSQTTPPAPAPLPYVKVAIAVPPTTACAASQLAMAFLGGEGGAGADFGSLVVRDTSQTWCSFTGPVSIWGLASTVRVVTDALTESVPVPIVLSPLTSTPQPTRDVTPPGVVQAIVEFAANENTCIPPYPTQPTPTVRIVPATLALSMPGGITLTASNRSYGTTGFPQFTACHGQFLSELNGGPWTVTLRR